MLMPDFAKPVTLLLVIDWRGVMGTEWTDDDIHRAGCSRELLAILLAIVEAEAEGGPRFLPTVRRAFLAAVLGRSYAPDLLELCHFITVADACARGRQTYEWLLWHRNPARGPGFRGLIAEATEGHGWRRRGFAPAATGVAISGGSGFTVNYSRMPYLCALADLVAESIGFDGLAERVSPLLADASAPPPAKLVAEIANALGRDVYAYLKPHLDLPQKQRKFGRAMRFLVGRLGDSFDPVDIDDEAVLGLWLDASGEAGGESADFKTFDGVFALVRELIDTLRASLSACQLDGAASIGTDRSQGEVDPDTIARGLSALMSAAEEEGDPLVILSVPPASDIKFLNDTEKKDALPVLAPGPLVKQLPLTLLRSLVFGAVQRRLSETERRDRDAEAVIAEPPQRDYAAWVARLEALERQMERALHAALHALLAARSPAAPTLIPHLAPAADLRRLAQTLRETAVPLNAEVAVQRLLAMLEEGDDSLAGLLREARQAHKGLNREGFDRLPKAGDALCSGFEIGVPAVTTIRQRVGVVRRHLGDRNVAVRFESDADVFRQQFRRLYGGRS